MPGRPPTVTTEEVIRAIALHPEPVVAANDIADEIGLTPPGARERMKTLVEEGYLQKKTVGSGGLVFWLTADGRALLENI